MPTIIFACKSNSCRSQMAEGWARNWIQKQKETIDAKLDAIKSNNDERDNTSKTKNHTSTKSSKKDVEMNNDKKEIQSQMSLLENTIIASVALDASSVFEKEETSIEFHNNEEKEEGKHESSLQSFIPTKRKQIKGKAIEAMAKDGVDIASYIPKTFDDLLPIITDGCGHKRAADNKAISSQCSFSRTKSSLSSSPSSSKKRDFETFHSTSTSKTNNNNPVEKNNQHDKNKPVDKLIVLCSCGDELKHQIARRSKSVEEWTIDPPTTAAKNGEGDAAYRRVSLEVRKEVTILMESLIGDALHSSRIQAHKC